MGARTAIPESGGFDPEEIAALLPIHGNVSFFAAPTMVSRLINHAGFAAADHRGLRTVIYGGAPMHFETLVRGLDLLGPKFAQIYGQGEVPMTITALSKAMHADRARPRWREIVGSVGCRGPMSKCASPMTTTGGFLSAISAKSRSAAKW